MGISRRQFLGGLFAIALTFTLIGSAEAQRAFNPINVKFAAISAASSGDNSIVAAVASQKVTVLAYAFVASSAVTITWKSDVGGSATALSGAMAIAANSGVSVPYSPTGYFQTASGKALNLNLSGAIQVSGYVVYIQE